MDKPLAGKKALITGASTGIGAAIAALFARQGAVVGIHYSKSRQKASEGLAGIRAEGGAGALFQGDLRNARTAGKLADKFVKKFGAIDILVNNAGAVYDYHHFLDLDESAWDQTMNLNLKAPFLIGRRAFEFMKIQKAGRIINISSTAIKYAGPNTLHYIAAKSALEAITLGFSKEGARYNILVNAIRCGVIDTPMHTKISGYNAAQFKKRVKLIPLGRLGKPADVAAMALFLASESGDFITGETFTVAGGD